MATVYLARDLRHDRAVAIKVLRPELASSLGPERFLREIEIAAGLDHPHILPLYDSGEADGSLFYVMPFVEGESLRDRLTREGQLPLADAIEITREVADALSAAHSRNIVHRDIKPENIMLSGNHARVADFGIARAVSVAGGARLTSAGMAIGTPAYMSPEQASGDENIDARSDLYSLGCVLYEMLAGEPPYSGPTMQALLVKRLTEPVPRLSALRETVSPALEAVIHRVLSKTPADRPATAAAFIAELDSAATGASARRRPRTLTLAGLGLLALLAVAFAVNRLGRTRGTSTATPAAGVAALLARGDQLLRERTSESFAAAMTQYEAALARDSASAETLARIGYAYALFADWGWSYGGQGISALRARALALSERALAADSTSAVAWLARAYALVQVDPYRLRGASEAFERSLRIDSTSPEGWYQFGQTLMYLGEDSAAIHAYQRAFALDRERPMSLMSVAAILRKSGRLEEARRLIDSAVLASRTVTSPYVHVMRGVLALETGELSLAGDEAELALQLDTSFIVPARSLLVRVRVAEGNRSAAMAEMQTVLAAMDSESLSPTEALYASGALIALGRKAEMLDLLERTRPRGAQLWFYLRNPEFNTVRTDPRFARIVRESDPRDASDQHPP